MEIITSGITANLTEADVNEAIIDFMAKNGHEVAAEEIEYTMGRNPKQLKVQIVTGANGQKVAAAKKIAAMTETASDSSEKSSTVSEEASDIKESIFDGESAETEQAEDETVTDSQSIFS